MALAPDILEQIRDEIGPDLDVTDETPAGPLGDLETIFISADRGNYSTLRTALIVWKRRLFAYQSRSHDVTAGGSLMARSQRARFLQRRVKELELLVDYTLKGVNQDTVGNYEQNEDEGAEFSS